jgi:hypothetical protein
MVTKAYEGSGRLPEISQSSCIYEVYLDKECLTDVIKNTPLKQSDMDKHVVPRLAHEVLAAGMPGICRL